MQALRVVSLDLEGSDMMFAPGSKGVLSLWKEGSVLWYLTMSSNAFDLLGFVHLFWIAGKSKLETLDAVTTTRQ